MKIKEITRHLESFAPPVYQESYDNSRLLTGPLEADLTGVLITLDVIEPVIEEAIQKNCNLVVAHHPIIFKGLKSLTGKNYIERTILKAIKHDIAIYAIHTNLDNVHLGVNKKICDKIGLINTSILSPKKDTLLKLVTFVPKKDESALLSGLHKAGAGNIGNYSDCSFVSPGTGSFRPNDQADPHIGEHNTLEHVQEQRVEVILPVHLKHRVLQALRDTHPYEEVAYYLSALENDNQELGAGMIGNLPGPMDPMEFLSYLKEQMSLQCIRYTAPIHRKIKKVAVCGGSGSFLLSKALAKHADVFVSADFKYHEFFDAEKEIMIADIGHYESEVYTKELLYETITQKFPKFAVNLSETVTNPISYL